MLVLYWVGFTIAFLISVLSIIADNNDEGKIRYDFQDLVILAGLSFVYSLLSWYAVIVYLLTLLSKKANADFGNPQADWNTYERN